MSELVYQTKILVRAVSIVCAVIIWVYSWFYLITYDEVGKMPDWLIAYYTLFLIANGIGGVALVFWAWS